MSLRDWHIKNILRALRECGMEPGEITDGLQAIRDQYAHELAEKIRAKDWEGPCANGCCSGDSPEAAADLIDPEVTE